MQKQKTEINLKKKELSKNLNNRKQILIGKANAILQSGEYNSVDEIFKKVFNEDELKEIYNKNISDDKNENKSVKNKTEEIFTTKLA